MRKTARPVLWKAHGAQSPRAHPISGPLVAIALFKTLPVPGRASRAELLKTPRRAPDIVELGTCRPAAELTPAQAMEVNISNWAIETGLRTRRDAWRQDDLLRLPHPKALRIHCIFHRWANSAFMRWRDQQIKKNATFITPTFSPI